MYKQFFKQDWLKLLKLSTDYKVDAVIITGTPSKAKQLDILNKLLTQIDASASIRDFENVNFVRSTEIKIGKFTFWFDTSYGASYLSEIVHIGSILGSRKNILLGSCGGLSTSAKALNLVFPTYSYGDESTTRMYSRSNTSNKHYADSQLTDELKNLFVKDYKALIGPVITCQAHLGETMEDINNWSKEGYIGVEMESASMFAVSKHFNVPSAAVLHINDNLLENEYIGSTNNINKKHL